MMVNKSYYVKTLTPKVSSILTQYGKRKRNRHEKALHPANWNGIATSSSVRKRRKTRVFVCMTSCRAYGAAEVMASLQDEVKRQGLSGQVDIRPTGCHGFCAKAPVLAIEPLGIQYQEVAPQDAAEIVALSVKGHQLLDRLAYRDLQTQKPIFYREQIPFYQKQVKRVLANCGRIDPTRIEHSIAAGGYQAIVKALATMSPEQVVKEVTASRLRGRGGAGFSTGLKWQYARQAQGRPKYIICNADEGDPGFLIRQFLRNPMRSWKNAHRCLRHWG
jgi:NADH-quinone oxidoreductase subunit F